MKRRIIYAVTYPDGQLARNGLSEISADHALAGALRHWLRDDWFAGIEWGGRNTHGALYSFWPALKKNGWNILEIPTDPNKDPRP